MIIGAKFAGRCTKCGGNIAVGDKVEWVRGVKGVSHPVNGCPAKTFVVAPVAPAVNVPTVAPVNIDGALIVKFLTAAKAHIKFPKVRFLAPDGKSELRLSMAGASSKYPGSVQVKLNGNWIGRINADGSLTYGLTNTAGMVDTLKSVALNPAAAAAAYGALMGHCSFCNLPLTDEGSVEVGYGPICAAHYGLPHTAKGSKAVKTVGVVAPLPVTESESYNAEMAAELASEIDPEYDGQTPLVANSRFRVIKNTVQDALAAV